MCNCLLSTKDQGKHLIQVLFSIFERFYKVLLFPLIYQEIDSERLKKQSQLVQGRRNMTDSQKRGVVDHQLRNQPREERSAERGEITEAEETTHPWVRDLEEVQKLNFVGRGREEGRKRVI